MFTLLDEMATLPRTEIAHWVAALD